MVNGIIWTEEEERILSENYKKLFPKEVMKRLEGRSYGSIKGKAHSMGLSDHVIPYELNKNYFRDINVETAYWAGFIAADGTICRDMRTISISQQKGDINQLINFRHCIGYNGPIKTYRGGSAKPESEIAVIQLYGAKNLVKDLGRYYNITPRKSLTLAPPNIVCYKNKLAYAAGLLDGDGSIRIADLSSKGYTYTVLMFVFSGTEMVMNWIKQLFDDLIPAKRRVASVSLHNSKTIYQYRVAGNRAERFAEIILALECPVMARKWNKARLWLES